jgi:hypothetical protein
MLEKVDSAEVAEWQTQRIQKPLSDQLPSSNDVEATLVGAIARAADAGQWAIVADLARVLAARRGQP